jgi:hypothetical protein
MMVRIQEPANFLLEPRNRFEVRDIELPGEVDEVLEGRSAFRGNDLYAGQPCSLREPTFTAIAALSLYQTDR